MPGRRNPIVGILSPGQLLSTEGVLELTGLGEISLAEARKSKLVKPIRIGTRNWYRSGELIAWMESQGDRKQHTNTEDMEELESVKSY